MESIDSTLKIYIKPDTREELFTLIFNDEDNMKDYLSSENLERICLGKTHLPDYAYSQIRKLLKIEYKIWKENELNSVKCVDTTK